MVELTFTVRPSPSLTVETNAYLPGTVGSPEIFPSGWRVTPGGSAPLVSVQVNVPCPPLAVSAASNGTRTSALDAREPSASGEEATTG